MENGENLVPLSIAASRLGIQARDLRLAVERGEVPCVRVGERGILFDLDVLRDRLLERARNAQEGDGSAKEARP
jgi:hypothetical protein